MISVTFRAPAVLAWSLRTLDRISSSRIHAGLGAGVNEAEHQEAGIHFGTPAERLRALERTALAVREICGPSMPVVIGASGDRALKLVARYADEWNCGAMYLDRVADRVGYLAAMTQDREKPIRRSINLPIVLSAPKDAALARQYNFDLALRGDLDKMISRVRQMRLLGFDSVWLGGGGPAAFERAVELLPRLKEL